MRDYDVSYQLPEYTYWLAKAERVECVARNLVKEKGEEYLPKPNPDDKSKENDLRYKNFLRRAVFSGFTGYTLNTLVGQAFAKPPQLEVTPALEFVADDIDGAGVSIYQQSQKSLESILMLGQQCLYVDYPRTDGAQTRAEMAALNIRPSTVRIDPKRVINWRAEQRGGVYKLTLVVYKDDQNEVTPDGFGSHKVVQYRVLKLSDQNVYFVEIYRKNQKDEWVLFDEFVPVDGAGNPLNEIPFIFVGACNNDTEKDAIPLRDIAEINEAHYRNSASNENSIFYSGEAQPWMSGLTSQWVEMLEEQGVKVGGGSMIMLPEGGAFGIEQVSLATGIRSEMEAKKDEMISLGARMIQSGTAVKTATQVQNEADAQHSVLSLAVSNLSEAYAQCLQWMQLFLTGEPDSVQAYEINSDYSPKQFEAQMLLAFRDLNLAGLVPKQVIWKKLRDAGVIDEDFSDEDLAQLLSEDVGGSLDA